MCDIVVSSNKVSEAQKKASAKYRLNNKDKINARRNKLNYEKKHGKIIEINPEVDPEVKDCPSESVELPTITGDTVTDKVEPMVDVKPTKRIRKTKKE